MYNNFIYHFTVNERNLCFYAQTSYLPSLKRQFPLYTEEELLVHLKDSE